MEEERLEIEKERQWVSYWKVMSCKRVKFFRPCADFLSPWYSRPKFIIVIIITIINISISIIIIIIIVITIKIILLIISSLVQVCYYIPREQWFLRQATKGEKPLQATVCFSIEHARSRDVYVKYSNGTTSSRFSGNIRDLNIQQQDGNENVNKTIGLITNKTTTLHMYHGLFCISLPFLHVRKRKFIAGSR